jgi:hypothetical protein
MGDDPRSFDELMARMGVEKLGGKTAKKKPEAAVEAPRPKPKPRVAKPKAPEPAAPKRDDREEQLAEARATIEALRAELEEARRPPPVDPSSLAALLETRGIRGADEARGLLEALAQARLTDALLGELVVRRPDRIAPFLRDKVLLSCGRPSVRRSQGSQCSSFRSSAATRAAARTSIERGGGSRTPVSSTASSSSACGVDPCGTSGCSNGRRRIIASRSGFRVRRRRASGRRTARDRLERSVEVGPRAIATQARNAVALMDEVAESLLT